MAKRVVSRTTRTRTSSPQTPQVNLQQFRTRIQELLTTFRARIDDIRARILGAVPVSAGGGPTRGVGAGILGGVAGRTYGRRGPAVRGPARRGLGRRGQAPAERARERARVEEIRRERGRKIPVPGERYDFTYATGRRIPLKEEKYDFTY